MEHFKNPFLSQTQTLFGDEIARNRKFFEDVLARAKTHRFFSHAFTARAHDHEPTREVVAFMLTSFYKIVRPFTGLLCTLGGRAPTLQSRFALMDNIYEEMGRGDIDSAHPSLYLKMLRSIGVTEEAADAAPTLAPVRRINDHLQSLAETRPFAVGCAVLASAEATISPSFPILAAMTREAFPSADMAFFDRHGPRDDGHADDASMLFAHTADRSLYSAIEDAVLLDLDYRADLFDEWMIAINTGTPRVRPSQRPSRPPPSVRPASRHPSAPPPR